MEVRDVPSLSLSCENISMSGSAIYDVRIRKFVVDVLGAYSHSVDRLSCRLCYVLIRKGQKKFRNNLTEDA